MHFCLAPLGCSLLELRQHAMKARSQMQRLHVGVPQLRSQQTANIKSQTCK